MYKRLVLSILVAFVFAVSLKGVAFKQQKQQPAAPEELHRTFTAKPLRRIQSQLQNDLYRYMSIPENRESVKTKAIKLNHGSQRNSCVYFASEALRRVGFDVPITISYTGNIRTQEKADISLLHFLQCKGWKISKKISLLLPGDICFTAADLKGHPTHVYIFMGWVKKDSIDYGYVCDNQSYDYETTLHIRNILIPLKGKEPFYCFMYRDATLFQAD